MTARKPGKVPLERALSKLGVASRTRAREWIVAGRVAVNGVLRRDPAFPVVPERAAIAVDGKPCLRPSPRTILFHKPRGVVTTRSDEKGRRTVFDLIGEEQGLHAVGRLDMASSGLLLLTNDTRLSSWLTDPRNRVLRVYIVTVRGRITPEEHARIESGVQDKGEQLHADEVVLLKASGKESHMRITLTEGKNREIRRLCEAVGHEVTRLKRISFGGLSLGDLPPGKYRELSPEELHAAFSVR